MLSFTVLYENAARPAGPLVVVSGSQGTAARSGGQSARPQQDQTAERTSQPHVGSGGNRADALTLTLTLFAGWTVLVYYVMGVYQQRPYPFNTPLFLPRDQVVGGQPSFLGHFFGDYWLTVTQSGDPSPYLAHSGPLPSPYLPFAHVLLRPLTLIPLGVGLSLYLAVITAFSAATVYVICRTLPWAHRARLTLLLGVFSYPVLFLLDRGNFEGVVFIFTLAGVFMLRRQPYVAAVCLAVAASVKPFPLVLVALLLADRAYRAAAAACALFLGLTVGAAASFEGGLRANIQGILDSFDEFQAFTAGATGLQHASDVGGALLVLTNASAGASVNAWLTALSALLLSAAAAWVAFARPVRSIGASILLVAVVVAPHPAFDYRLIYLLLPVAFFVREGYGVGPDALWAAMWAAAVAPLSWPVVFADVGVGVVVRPLLLLILAGAIVLSHYLRPRPPSAQAPEPRRQRPFSASRSTRAASEPVRGA